MRFFLLVFLLLNFQTVLAKSTAPHPELKPAWVQDWKNIQVLSRQDRNKACEKIEQLSWAQEFPFPHVIEDKKSFLCRKPPSLVTPDFENLIKASQFYRNDFEHQKAQEFLKKAFTKAKTKSQKITYWEEQLKIDRAAQDKIKRLRSARKLKELDPDQFLVDYARLLWTYDKTQKAIQTLNEARKLFKKTTSQQEVLFVLGRIQEERKRSRKALVFYNQALQEPLVSIDVQTKILSFAAWVHYKLNEFEPSEKFWQKLYDQSPERFTKSRALYWMAICQKKMNQKELSIKTLERLIQEDPVSYYTVLAYRELKTPFTPIKPFQENIKIFEKLKILNKQEKNLLSWLVAFDEKDLAEILLLSVWDEALTASEDQQSAYFQTFWKLGLTNSLIRALNQLNDETRIKLTQKYQAALFPYHYEKEILEASLEENLNPYFVMALIRQESAFNPEARSPTDALGLMQVMPALAKKIAVAKKLDYTKDSELFNPLLNIKIGTRELKERLDDFKGNSVLASASYNAGADVVKSWLKSRYQEDPIEFIEAIPYEETRSYVRLIIRNEIFYQRFFTKVDFFFPDEKLTQGWKKERLKSR